VSFSAYDPKSFDLIVPASVTAGDIEVAYAAVTVSPDTAVLLCDRIGWARGTAAALVKLLDTLPRFHKLRPGYRDMEIERALERLPAEGFVLSRWEERGGRLPVGGGAMTVTPFGVSWWASVYGPQAGDADEAVGEAALPPIIGRVETGMVGLAVLRRIADGELALSGREPI